MNRLVLGLALALALAVAGAPSHAGEEELEVNLQTGRRLIEPDPLELPQWRPDDRAALAAGNPVNLGGGLWGGANDSPGVFGAVVVSPNSTEAEDRDFVRPVDLGQLTQGPWPVASVATPDAEALARGARRARTPVWLSVLRVLAPVLTAISLVLHWISRRQHRRPRLFELPEPDAPHRLGGWHSGGSGAVLRW